MKLPIPASFDTTRESFWDNAHTSLLGKKEIEEFRDAFDFLKIWREDLQSEFGALHSITHLSNPDDPPDVIAHFEKGDLNIEITSLEPFHIHQSEPLKGQFAQTGLRLLPISSPPRSRVEAEQMMTPIGDPQLWENVSDRCDARKETIISRVMAKLENRGVRALKEGLILLTGDLMGDPNEERALRSAFEELSAHPLAAGWEIGTVHQWNDSSFYSTLYSSRDGFRIRK
ncbi:MAG: hypothetical protein EBR40_02845 [Proteobacteria bacterium]|nr:hypothetical protein [Pseudomonadota bacterium]